MPSSIQIHNHIRELDESIANATEAFNKAEGDARDAFRDQICQYKGEQKALKDQLGDVLAEEERVRKGGGLPVVAEAPKPKVLDVVTGFLGTREEFEKRGGMANRVGELMNVSEAIRAAADTTGQFALPGPSRTDYTLPENVIELPMGVLDTLAKGTTDATSLTYMIPGEFTNNAAIWTPGNVKAESDEKWDKRTMNMFVVAHWIAISKQAANHYGQLQSLIANDLMYGLRAKERAFCLNLDNGDNEHGILKDSGIQVYTAKKGENLYDSARRMKTASWMATGYQPDHIAMHPYASEQLDLLKSSDGVYLRLSIDGRTWGVPIVEDVNLTETTGTTGKETTTYGALMYNSRCATWYTSETDALTMGLVNNQFIKNEYTLLAEGEHGITINRPKSFVYLKDAVNVGA